MSKQKKSNFQDFWLQNETFKTRLQKTPVDLFKARCKVCAKDISVGLHGITRLWHMRHVIAHACLCTCLKQRHAKESMPCLIKKASRCAADHTSRTTMFFIILSTFYKMQRSHEKIMCICYFIGSLVKIVLYLHFLDINDERLWQIKKKHEWWNNRFSDILLIFSLW